ncbi:MAG TPA: protein kinase [Holophagaceae bacterium]|nr:protein kinase [Holophagaceae bacterium]
MALASGTLVSHFEISGQVGAGGMGEVYRARDHRLGRDVAIKVLLPELAGDPARSQRFQQEARSASALNHPNIVTLHDIGSFENTLFLAMEFVEGPTLRDAFPAEPLPTRKLLEVAVQIAEGLAAAHAAGVVHRDLKPENLVLTKSGAVKILDFGLAKLIQGPSGENSQLATLAGLTHEGMVMGTVGYMSPEQACGHEVDFRSDQFSFGTILYELATGIRAFSRPTAPETLAAIIRDEPVPLERLNPKVPAPLRWIIERCLAKEPAQRFASTTDLARDLQTLRDHLGDLSGAVEAQPPAPSPQESPAYQRLTFRRGSILNARFSPDARTVVYGAAWEGAPCRLFTTRPESPDSIALQLPDCEILAISSTGQMAVSLEPHWAGRFIWAGTLAQVPLLGAGSPRELLEDVQWADWSPDGSALAIIRSVGGKTRLEYPIGKVLYETAGWISHLRVSPKGDRIAFLDHPLHGDDSGSVRWVGQDGRVETLSEGWITAYGLAWAPEGDRILFTATRVGNAAALWSVPIQGGAERLLARTPSELHVQDVAKDGRVLVTNDNAKVGIVGMAQGHTKEQDLSLLDWSLVRGISEDGKMILFDETGEGAGALGGAYVRKTDGAPPVRLGDGIAGGFSPDGRWVTSLSLANRTVVLLPVKAGEPRRLPTHGLDIQRALWLPDGQHLLLAAYRGDEGLRLWIQALDETAEVRPVTPEGIAVGTFPISPDGRVVLARAVDQRFHLFPLAGGDAEPVPGLTPEDSPIRFAFDARFLYGFRRGEMPTVLFRLDLVSGQREAVRELVPPDPAGVVEIPSVVLTADAAGYAYSYHRILSDLIQVTGVL